jgi:uncharacterized protein YwgA
VIDAKIFVQLAMLAMSTRSHDKQNLQKTVHLLGEMTGYLDDLGYQSHFYGPYSDEVNEAIGWLRTIGAVDIASISVGWVNDSGIEIRRHEFRLKDPGIRFASATASRHPDLWRDIQKAVRENFEMPPKR